LLTIPESYTYFDQNVGGWWVTGLADDNAMTSDNKNTLSPVFLWQTYEIHKSVTDSVTVLHTSVNSVLKIIPVLISNAVMEM